MRGSVLSYLSRTTQWVMKKIWIGTAILLLSVAVFMAMIARQCWPDYAFEQWTDSVEGEVEIVFDDMAVPHIYADSESDAMYALGYVHASERLWQMDLLRRAGAGELSALLGADMVENDTYLRTLGMRESAIRTATEFEASAPEHIQLSMKGYLDGINAFIAEDRRPLEYRLVGSDPRPFTVQDVFCSTGYMAYSFAVHLKTEPILDWMKYQLGAPYWKDLAVDQTGFTRIPTANEVAISEVSDISGLSSRVHALDALRPVPQWLGSNAWVISPDRTASGHVVFCNDAHMAYASPSVWYEAHIVTPEVEYYGNHLAGLPFPAIGHTRDHAWGITMFVNDDIDFYRETIEGDRYLHGGEWLPLEIVEETIEVAGGDPVTFEVRKTHHGPLIEEGLSMWWTYTQHPENRLHEAFYGFSRSSGIEEFQRHAAMMHAPGVNLMYGDARGNIGWWACAKLPVRPDHVDTKTFIDGTDPANEVMGWHSFEMNPQLVNPDRGFVYSANNAPEPVSDSIRYPGHYYSGNTRAAGIFNALSEPKNDWTVKKSQQVQLDDRSLVYKSNAEAMVALARIGGVDPTELENWDGSHGVRDIEPTIYYRWMYRTICGAMLDEFQRAAPDGSAVEKFESWHKTIVSENTFPRLLANVDSPWWDDVNTEGIETAADVVAAAWVAAREDLAETLGEDPAQWRYGRLHTVTHRHAMTDVPLLGDWLDVGPMELPAAKDALNKYEFKLKEAVNYEVFSGPSMRIGMDFADVAGSESILPTGQSGNVFSPFYSNQTPLYHSGQFRKQRMDREDIEAHETSRSAIRPVNQK